MRRECSGDAHHYDAQQVPITVAHSTMLLHGGTVALLAMNGLISIGAPFLGRKISVAIRKKANVGMDGPPLSTTLLRLKNYKSPSHLKKFLETKAMSRRNGPKLDLKLNLSPPRVNWARVESPGRSSTSPPSSCVSSELINPEESLFYSNSPEATSMVLVGCPRCLMYVMLAEEDPKCPKCKSTVLLDIIHQKNATSSKKTKKS
ncbi:Hypothetical predicted protein [Olea europaea subsp. europaea]|uniref:GIR1-like zinc ribbon domain-containing protein n=1 Tax=Olea europaea subsp. europaea TaxID=158383 RepID=A0A8S0TAA7_OLEEU|nr:Hypothetical predicted protein [Olea europaea subsp. europaea]